MATIASAYVQIVPSADGISGSLSSVLAPEASSAGDKAGKSIGASLSGALGKAGAIGAAALGATTAATTAMVSGFTAAAGATASVGDEIDKQSQKLGVSASEYQALSFAAEHCGFSTSVYQRAIRQLQSSGYEGTLMDYMNGLMSIEDPAERAAKAQEELGERTANEMMAYINGSDSMSDYQAQLESLGGMMSDDAVKASATYEDSLTNLQHSFGGLKNSLMADFLPSITSVMDGLTMIISGDEGGVAALQQGIEGFIAQLAAGIPQIMQVGGQILGTLAQAILTNLPTIVNSAVSILIQLVDAIIVNLPLILSAGWQILQALGSALITNLPILAEHAWTVVTQLAAYLAENGPILLQTGADMLGNMINGLVEHIPDMITTAATVVTSLVGYLLEHLPELLQAGFDLIKNVASGIINNLPEIAKAAGEAIAKLLATIGEKLPDVLAKGGEILVKIITGFLSHLGDIPGAVGNVINSFKSGFNGFDWGSIGSNIINGLVNGIKNGIGAIKEAATSVAKGAFDAAKSFLGIASPSKLMRDEIGKWIPEGVAVGIEKNADVVGDAMTGMDYGIEQAYNMQLGSPIRGGAANVQGAQLAVLGEILQAIKDGKVITIDGETTIGWVNSGLGALA